MKTIFTRSEMSKLKGCYTEQQVDQLYAGRDGMALIEILDSDIPLKDKVYFLFKKCELTLQQKQQLSYELAVIVAPIYNEKYPNDSCINDCLEAVRSFNAGEITKQELENFADAAYAATAAVAYAAYAAYAAYTAAYAAYADAFATSASAAASAYAAYTAASAATAATAAKDDIKYTKKILSKIKEFMKNN